MHLTPDGSHLGALDSRPGANVRFRPKAVIHPRPTIILLRLDVSSSMRMILSLLLVGVFGLSGCSIHGGLSSERGRESFDARQAHYQKLASEPTPDAWRAGADWEFVTTGKDGAVEESFVVRVTDAPQDACLSGDWRKLEIVSGNTGKLRAPAYVIDGRNLHVLLSTALCDAYPMYEGELSDNEFAGTYNFTHMQSSEEHGKVSGRPVRLFP